MTLSSSNSGEKDNRNRNNKEIYGQLIYFDHFSYSIKDTLLKKYLFTLLKLLHVHICLDINTALRV